MQAIGALLLISKRLSAAGQFTAGAIATSAGDGSLGCLPIICLGG
jgi:hypothetical protein